jgi:hypothetical protein
MSDEDESTETGVTAAELEIIKFLSGREANEAIFDDEVSCKRRFAMVARLMRSRWARIVSALSK